MTDDFEPLTVKKGKNDKLVLNWSKENDEPEEDLVPMIEQEALREITEKAKAEGYQQGLQQGANEIEALKQKLASALNLISQPLSLLDEALERNILELVIFLAQEVLGAEFNLSAEHIKPYFNEICSYLPINQSKAKLVLSAHDAAYFREVYQDLNTEFDIENLVEDETLANGDFRILTEDGEVDGRFEPRIRELINKAMNDTLEVDDE